MAFKAYHVILQRKTKERSFYLTFKIKILGEKKNEGKDHI